MNVSSVSTAIRFVQEPLIYYTWIGKYYFVITRDAVTSATTFCGQLLILLLLL